MRYLFLYIGIILTSGYLNAQKGHSVNKTKPLQPSATQAAIMFEIEQLEPPANALTETPDSLLFRNLFFLDANKISKNPAALIGINQQSVVARSVLPEKLVAYGYHSFFDGVYRAYADHRPLVISPDMIWLLIAQGFSQHINHNAAQYRKLFVAHSGQATLMVRNDAIRLDDPNSPWEQVFPEFTRQIADYTGPELIQTLTADFSTTTATTRLTSQITIMDAMKSYFEYVVFMVGCGIPRVTLEGTPTDWEAVYKKANSLKKYDLDWWLNELEPVLRQFIAASKGKVDKDFWRNLFKVHKAGKPYQSDKIDGWFVKFFPYTKDGKRNDLQTLTGSSNLPDEIVKVQLRYVFQHPDGSTVQTPLELWAGFVGLQQNSRNFTLKPQTGWMIKKKAGAEKEIQNDLERQLSGSAGITGPPVSIRVTTIPDVILHLKKISNLLIMFTDSIRVPDAMGKISIERLTLKGTISKDEKERLKQLFPNTILTLNTELLNHPGSRQ
ncbi:DUF4419 domain-containing protein [Niabella sp. CC-SYL272]|uniref:DUF4419 domain-containing protein n=1 Tax=Niabella agricola TaxID=2891571 RepID=UPI001F48ACF8|nr:DUF4419 domain-containing protein [Niabella agricola]MCF3110215.1 DUF4419 domain-containing protein [Niabella agricola]